MKPEYREFLLATKVKNNWSYKALGDRLNVSGAFAHNIIKNEMNITTNPYMLKIASGIVRLEQGELTVGEAEEGISHTLTRSYTYPLRDELEVRFTLPKDLTEKEADRLSLFLRSLPQ